jgi:hypothetical protein
MLLEFDSKERIESPTLSVQKEEEDAESSATWYWLEIEMFVANKQP